MSENAERVVFISSPEVPIESPTESSFRLRYAKELEKKIKAVIADMKLSS